MAIRPKEFINRLNMIHGHTRNGIETPEYRSWESMRRRCLNKDHEYYYNYGGRGVKICKRWMLFENFYADMGPRPSLNHTLDRYPDINGDYKPSNCRWATKKQQANNRRSNIVVEYNGEKKNLKEWSEHLGVSYKLIHKRINTFGWTIEEAFNTPVKRSNRYLYGYK